MAAPGLIRKSKQRWLLYIFSAILLGAMAEPGLIRGNAPNAQPFPGQDNKGAVERMLPFLSRACEDKDRDIYPALLEYAILVLKPDWIKTDDDLILLFQKRESLMQRISASEPFFDFLSNEASRWIFNHQSGDWDHYEHEFNFMGIRTVFAEGMLTGFAEGPVLAEIIQRVASEPYRLYIKLVETYARSYGHEYTYIDLRPEREAAYLGEQFLRSFPESKYVERVRKILGEALFPLTDWHIVLPIDDRYKEHPSTIVGGLDTRAFPFGTDIGEPKKFLEEYPNSRFSGIIARIVNDPSEIFPGNNVYIAIVDECQDEKTARRKILDYLLQGMDIPHLITLSEKTVAVAYRFFADPEKAKRALDKIKRFKPAAFIQTTYPPDYKWDAIPSLEWRLSACTQPGARSVTTSLLRNRQAAQGLGYHRHWRVLCPFY
jgi:hypothetical protein